MKHPWIVLTIAGCYAILTLLAWWKAEDWPGTGFVVLVLLIALVLVRCWRDISVDSCLDMGGKWNYEANSCEGARS